MGDRRGDDPEQDRRFVKPFNVADANAESYKRFIKLLRQLLTDRFSRHGTPVLPREQSPREWFHIILHMGDVDNGVRVTLRIRLDNLYLDGYRTSDNHWYEFNSGEQLIRGSEILPYDGGYTDLERDGHGSRTRGGINLGRNSLINAVHQLASSDTTDPNRARSLMVVIQMICESIRFERISNHLATELGNDQPAPGWMQALENGWRDLSDALLRSEALNPDPRHYSREEDDPRRENRPFPLAIHNDMNIQTAQAAAAVAGILKSYWFDYKTGRRLQSTGMSAFEAWHQGRPMVEVFSVCISRVGGLESTIELYGKITVSDGLGRQVLYNRNQDDYESISIGKNLTLTGPADRAISALGSFTINLDLTDKDFVWDDQVSKGLFSWNVYHTKNQYDKLLSKDVEGKNGSVTVNYVVLSNAVQATIEIRFLYASGERTAEIYGDITARNTNIGNEIIIFHKERNEYIELESSNYEPIPLLRSIVVVPLNSSLIVESKLYDADLFPFSDDVVAKGSAEFPAHTSGRFSQKISGDSTTQWVDLLHFKWIYNQIEVIVEWNI